MPSPFEFAPGISNTVELNANNEGVTTFTVTNVANRHINAVARIRTQPDDSPASNWITVLPSDQDRRGGIRKFDIGGTHSYEVKVSPSEAAEAGQYTFRLVVADEANPDEHFTVGPDVTFRIRRKEEQSRRQFPWLLVAVAVVVAMLVVGGIVAALLLSRPPEDPHIVIASAADVYESPDATAATVEPIDGTVFLVGGTSDGKWVAFEMENGEWGWVSVQDGEVGGNSTAVAALPTPTDTPIPPPVAAFEADHTEGTAPLTVNFDSSASSGSITSYSWDFGDRNTSTEQNPTHEYVNPGTYTVTLIVRGPGGEDANEMMVTVNEREMSDEVPTPLLNCDNVGEVSLNLVESWEVSEDGILWTFNLRQDETLIDGTILTSDKVINGLKAEEFKDLFPYQFDIVDDFTFIVVLEELEPPETFLRKFCHFGVILDEGR